MSLDIDSNKVYFLPLILTEDNHIYMEAQIDKLN